MKYHYKNTTHCNKESRAYTTSTESFHLLKGNIGSMFENGL